VKIVKTYEKKCFITLQETQKYSIQTSKDSIKIEEEIAWINKQIQIYKEKINQFTDTTSEDDWQFLQLKEQKQKIINQQDILNDEAKNILSSHFTEDLWFEKPKHFWNLQTLSYIVNKLITDGKLIWSQNNQCKDQIIAIKMKQEHLQEKVNDLSIRKGTNAYEKVEQEQKRLKESKEYEIQTLLKEKESIDAMMKEIQSKLDIAQKNLLDVSQKAKDELIFHCDKIDNLCPFISKINTKAYETMNDEKKKREKDVDELKEQIQNIDYSNKTIDIEKQIETITRQITYIENEPEEYCQEIFWNIKRKKEELLQQIKKEDYQEQRDLIEKNLVKWEEKLKKLKSLLQGIDWKMRQKKELRYNELQLQKDSIDKQIFEYEKQEKQREECRKEIIKLTAHMQSKQEQKSNMQNQIHATNIKIEELQLQVKQLDYDIYPKCKNNMQHCQKTIDHIQKLVIDNKEQQRKLHDAQEQYKVANDLHKIFSQELVLLVLENSIPALTDIINSFLAQVVEYTIDMIIETDKDTVSLAIEIIDEKWNREVKSLSGGQKVVLKICRMLAITAFTNSKMLFLDETINNLDAETIGGVATMIEDFIKQHDITFYVVTHSQQIQEMCIWDEILEL